MTFLRNLSLFIIMLNTIYLSQRLLVLRFSRKKNITLAIAFSVPSVFLTMLIIVVKGAHYGAVVFPFTFSLPNILLAYYLSYYKGARYAFSVCTIAVAGCWIVTITGLIPPLPGDRHFLIMLILRIAFCIALDIFVVKRFRHDLLIAFEALDHGWGALCTLSALCAILIVFMVVYPENLQNRREEMPTFFAFLVFLPILYYVMIYSIIHQLKVRINESQKKILKHQNDALVRQIQAFQDAEEKLRIQRHDSRHMINQLATMLQQGEPEEALKLLGQAERQYDNVYNTYYCENKMVNATLSHYCSLARDNAITVHVQAALPEDDMPIESFELSVAIANALENAIHSCLKITDIKKRKINVLCVLRNQLIVQITNTVQGEVLFSQDGYPISEDGMGGIGTRSIGAFADKHGATWDFKAENGQFVFRMIMKC